MLPSRDITTEKIKKEIPRAISRFLCLVDFVFVAVATVTGTAFAPRNATRPSGDDVGPILRALRNSAKMTPHAGHSPDGAESVDLRL